MKSIEVVHVIRVFFFYGETQFVYMTNDYIPGDPFNETLLIYQKLLTLMKTFFLK